MGNPLKLFITGHPGVGKTTLIQECVLPYRDKIGGFYTKEIREGSARLGFEILTMDGRSGVFAKKGLKSAAKFNKYGIDLAVLETVGVDSLRRAEAEKPVIVLDEIGSMEMLSETFREMIARILSGPKPLLATIRLNAEPFTSQIKKMNQTELLVLNRTNHPDLKMRVRRWVEDILDGR